MTKPAKYRKLKKFFRDPNMFFYDMFRKRVFKDAPASTIQKTTASPTVTSPSIDLFEINRVGVVEYLRSLLGAAIGPEDGKDPNSLLIWSGYLQSLVTFIASLKDAMSMQVTIYTLGGGYSLTANPEDNFDVKSVTRGLNSRPDFVIELCNAMGELFVLHIYQFDLAPTGEATVRSNRAWIRRFPLDRMEQIFGDNSETLPTPIIDAVYTWVNHADPKWQKQWLDCFPDEAFDPDRYTSNDELRYSLRSLHKFAPWLNKIYIVSNCEQPAWLELSDKVQWISHTEIFPSSDYLPTFNSHAIEACLHLIPGLSEKFIYLNDDFVLNQPCLPTDFFDETGRSVSYFEPYGMVHSATTPSDELPDYLIAAQNSKKLLKERFPSYEPRNLHRHVPYALKKSTLETLEKTYASTFSRTRSARRRSETDINLTSFFYHHYSFAAGLAVYGDAPGLIVRPENIKALSGRDVFKYKLLCFNDGNGSSEDSSYKDRTQAFFDLRLSQRAPWERLTGTP